MSLFRRDPVTGRWTIFTPGKPLIENISVRHRSDTAPGFCPFCPGHESKTPNETFTIKSQDGSQWKLRVVPNKFPALSSDALPAHETYGIYDLIEGFGIHEVVIESPNHTSDFGKYSSEEARNVVRAWQERMKVLSVDKRVRYIMLFRNCGAEAGASLEHPHSQIIAIPIFPRLVADEIELSRRYYEWKERCVFCDIIHEEQAQGIRILIETENFISFVPYAARFPYETWILPRRHQSHFYKIDDKCRDEFAELLLQTLKRIDIALNLPPFNLVLHTTPCHEGEVGHYHWHLEIIPRLARIAGFEWGTGFYLNPILPEDAAKKLNSNLE